ncbi:hypothetical protein B0T19DRAFT_256643 [Cercophora scortea]|uniref:Uncharacterized protein n=1 Tax=Cercophora scortea TaxID=314031 RepID=A0AAE0I9I0_9PEZI|nr:hypothetical protein B0T19DRAFT_256643 [Cercophora scortea]
MPQFCVHFPIIQQRHLHYEWVRTYSVEADLIIHHLMGCSLRPVTPWRLSLFSAKCGTAAPLGTSTHCAHPPGRQAVTLNLNRESLIRNNYRLLDQDAHRNFDLQRAHIDPSAAATVQAFFHRPRDTNQHPSRLGFHLFLQSIERLSGWYTHRNWGVTSRRGGQEGWLWRIERGDTTYRECQDRTIVSERKHLCSYCSLHGGG